MAGGFARGTGSVCASCGGGGATESIVQTESQFACAYDIDDNLVGWVFSVIEDSLDEGDPAVVTARALQLISLVGVVTVPYDPVASNHTLKECPECDNCGECTTPPVAYAYIDNYSVADGALATLVQAQDAQRQVLPFTAPQLADFNQNGIGTVEGDPASVGPFDGRVSRLGQVNLSAFLSDCLLDADTIDITATVTVGRDSELEQTFTTNDGSIIIGDTGGGVLLATTDIPIGTPELLAASVTTTVTKAQLVAGDIVVLLNLSTQDETAGDNAVTWRDACVTITTTTTATCDAMPVQGVKDCDNDRRDEILMQIRDAKDNAETCGNCSSCTPDSVTYISVDNYSELDADLLALVEAADPNLEILEFSAAQLQDFNLDKVGNVVKDPTSFPTFDGRVVRIGQVNLDSLISSCLIRDGAITITATVTATRDSESGVTVADDGAILIANQDTNLITAQTNIPGGDDDTVTVSVSDFALKTDIEAGNTVILLALQTQDGIDPIDNGVNWTNVCVTLTATTLNTCDPVAVERVQDCDNDRRDGILSEIRDTVYTEVATPRCYQWTDPDDANVIQTVTAYARFDSVGKLASWVVTEGDAPDDLTVASALTPCDDLAFVVDMCCRGELTPELLENVGSGGDLGFRVKADDRTSLWQDTIATIQADAIGNPVARADDISGEGQHFIQNTVGDRGALVNDGFRNRVEMTTGTDHLERTLTNAPVIGSAFTVAYVFEPALGTAQNGAFISSTTGASPDILGSWQVSRGVDIFGTEDDLVFRYESAGGEVDTVIPYPGGWAGFEVSGKHLVLLFYDGADVQVFVDGVDFLTLTPTTGLLLDTIRMSRNRADNISPNGTFDELLMWYGTLTAEDVQIINEYAVCYHDITAPVGTAFVEVEAGVNTFKSTWDKHFNAKGGTVYVNSITGQQWEPVNPNEVPIPGLGECADTSGCCLATEGEFVTTDAVVTNVGSVAAGMQSVSFLNTHASASATVNGAVLGAGKWVNKEAYYDPVTNTFYRTPEIPYDATGSELRISVQE